MLHVSRNNWYTSPLLKRLPLHISEHITKTDIKNSATGMKLFVNSWLNDRVKMNHVSFFPSRPVHIQQNMPSVNSDKCVQNQGYIGNFSYNCELPKECILELCTYTISVWERIILQTQSPHSAFNSRQRVYDYFKMCRKSFYLYVHLNTSSVLSTTLW